MKTSGAPYFFQDIRLDIVSRTVSRGAERVALTPKEFTTLLYMVQHPGQAVSRDVLIEAIWPGTAVGDTSLARNISVLRRHFGTDCIRVVPKFGYRFECPVTREPPSPQTPNASSPDALPVPIAPEPFSSPLHPAPSWHFSRPVLAIIALVVMLTASLGVAVEHRRTVLQTASSPVMKTKHVPTDQAHKLFLTGSFELERRTLEGYRHAADAFTAATAADPKYADAYVGLSQAYIFMAGILAETECFPKARVAALAALRLDPDNAGAHRDLAFLLMNDGSQLRQSEQEYRFALQQDPHDARTHHWYAQLLAAERRTQESVQEASRGYELEPASVASGANYAFMLTQNGQAEEADRLLTRLVEREPNNDMAWGYLGFARLKLARYRDSARAFHVAAEKSTLKINYLSCAAYAMAQAGDPSEANSVMKLVQQRQGNGQWVPAQTMVLLELALHHREQALLWIQRGAADHSTTLFEVATDPVYTELHNEPSFQQVSLNLGAPR